MYILTIKLLKKGAHIVKKNNLKTIYHRNRLQYWDCICPERKHHDRQS